MSLIELELIEELFSRPQKEQIMEQLKSATVFVNNENSVCNVGGTVESPANSQGGI